MGLPCCRCSNLLAVPLVLNQRPTSVLFDAAPSLLQAAAILEEAGPQTHSQVLCRQNAKIHSCGQFVTRYVLLAFCRGSFFDPPVEFHFEKFTL